MENTKKEKNVRVVMVPVEPDNPFLSSEAMSPHSPITVASAEDEDSPAVKKKPKKHFEMIRMKTLIMKKEKEAQE